MDFCKTDSKILNRYGFVKASCPAISFEAQKDTLAREYSQLVNESKPWRWDDVKPLNNKRLTATQRSKIRHHAIDQGYVDEVLTGENGFPDFPDEYIKEDNTRLPDHLKTNTSDSVQFKWLNDDLAARDDSYNPKTQTSRRQKRNIPGTIIRMTAECSLLSLEFTTQPIIMAVGQPGQQEVGSTFEFRRVK